MIKVVKFENSEEILGENFNVTPAEMFSNGYVSEILSSKWLTKIYKYFICSWQDLKNVIRGMICNFGAIQAQPIIMCSKRASIS